jgi:hypothetical protein
MIVTNGLIVYAWVQAYIPENDNFVLMEFAMGHIHRYPCEGLTMLEAMPLV